MLTDAYVALGGNLGDVLATLREALGQLERDEAMELVEVSPVYRTRAMMPPGASGRDPDYWNGVVALRTSLSPAALLDRLRAVEGNLGRERHGRWRSRTLDLDLLLYGDARIRTPDLEVPHPGLPKRVFVLRPLCDIAPGASLPDGSTAAELLARHPDPNDGILDRISEWYGGREASIASASGSP